MLKRYCAWHKKYFGKDLFMAEPQRSPVSPQGIGGEVATESRTEHRGEVPAELDGVTHGICADCRKLLEEEMEYPEDAPMLTSGAPSRFGGTGHRDAILIRADDRINPDFP